MLKSETTTRETNSMPLPRHASFSDGIICGPHGGSFAVQFGDHFRSGDHLRSGIICGAVQYPLQNLSEATVFFTGCLATSLIVMTTTYRKHSRSAHAVFWLDNSIQHVSIKYYRCRRLESDVKYNSNVNLDKTHRPKAFIFLTCIDGSKLTTTDQWLLTNFSRVLQPIPSPTNWRITFNGPDCLHRPLTNTIRYL